MRRRAVEYSVNFSRSWN